MIELLGKTISQYRIIEKIGEGGMGIVYLAEDAKLHRKVALKFISPHLNKKNEAIDRFEREARAAATLNHPNIITIHDINEFEDPETGEKQTYIVMEYLNGIELRDLMQQENNSDISKNIAVTSPETDFLSRISPIHKQNTATILSSQFRFARASRKRIKQALFIAILNRKTSWLIKPVMSRFWISGWQS